MNLSSQIYSPPPAQTVKPHFVAESAAGHLVHLTSQIYSPSAVPSADPRPQQILMGEGGRRVPRDSLAAAGSPVMTSLDVGFGHGAREQKNNHDRDLFASGSSYQGTPGGRTQSASSKSKDPRFAYEPDLVVA